MKRREILLFIFSFTLLAHYFVLNYFSVDTTESFLGRVEKIETIDNGLFPRANIKLAVEDETTGQFKNVIKTISLIKEDLNKFKVGGTYLMKTHKNWLLSIKS